MNGEVKFFNEMKGFGFISGDDGKEYFVHQSGLTEGTRLREKDKVSFEVVQGDRGPKAENVTLGSSDDAQAESESEEPESTEEDED